MSDVTDIVLLLGAGEGQDDSMEDTEPASQVASINTWLRQQDHSGQLVRVDSFPPGSKCMQCQVYVAAINHLDKAAFKAVVHAQPWENEDDICLLMQTECCGWEISRLI